MRDKLAFLFNNIGTKIILPYLILTAVVGALGAYIVTNLVANSLEERFNNQLLDAGKTVSERMVALEAERLAVLRTVAGTTGVPTAAANRDGETIGRLVPQILANTGTDALIIVDRNGSEIFGWYDGQSSRFGADFGELPDVQFVLAGEEDELGDKRALIAEIPGNHLLLTIGPIIQGTDIVGAVLIGTNIRNMALDLSEIAIARVTLYDNQGEILASVFSQNPVDLAALQETPEKVQEVASQASITTSFRQIEVANQDYLMAFGDWRLRQQSFGMFSVALRLNFLLNAVSTSRDQLSILFSIMTACVLLLGFLIARRIVSPIDRLVETSIAVSQGDLSQRTGIQRFDEIGVLASAFDDMTVSLADRNRMLIEQASKLEAIINSIADGLLVLDSNNTLITENPTAHQIILDIVHDLEQQKANHLKDDDRMIMGTSVYDFDYPKGSLENWLSDLGKLTKPTRYQIGNRVFSALVSPVNTPDGENLGKVIVMRDVSREVEAEQRQNNFITSVSHELRTPLTSIKGYVDLMLANEGEALSSHHKMFATVIQRNTNQMVEHVEKLLDIAELQAGTIQFSNKEICLGKLTREILNNWTDTMTDKGITMEVVIPDEEILIMGDSKRLGWAIDNLLRNAHSYTLAGGRVWVRVYIQDNHANVSVQDTGVGIHATDLPFIFKKFFRAEHHQTMDVPGLGLELFITRSIVEGHRGRIWVESELGVGSTFGFAIPLAESVPEVVDGN